MSDECSTFAQISTLNKNLYNWFLFIVLSVIWGSSFILMKLGMKELTAVQVAAIRILSAGIILLPFAWKSVKMIPRNKMGYVVASGFFGSFFPAFLYCLAETRIDSSLAAVLNSFTPVFAIIIGVSFFQMQITREKIIGVIIGFIGLVLLPFASKGGVDLTDVSYSLLILLATVCYGINVNMVARHLKEVESLRIASLAFAIWAIPSFIILAASGFFHLPLHETSFLQSVSASAVLGIFGTAIASVLFYMLVKSAGTIFASLVTYGIPFIAIVWGLIFNESVTILQVVCLGIILAGVYLVNRKK